MRLTLTYSTIEADDGYAMRDYWPGVLHPRQSRLHLQSS